MKQRIFTIFCLAAFVSLPTFAQPTLQWDKRFNGSIGNDQGNATDVDASGNVYIAASSDGSNFLSDYLIIKYNSTGDTLWSRRYNGSANGIDAAVAIKSDASGNVYVTGYSQSSGTGYDIVTLKYNAQGVQQWAKVFEGGNSGANKDDIGYDLAVDIAGNVYVVGSSYPAGGAQTDGVAIKYSPAGTLLWKININESANYPEITNIITINTLGNVVVTEGIYTVEGGYLVIELNPSNGAVIKKYNIYTFPPGLFPVIGSPDDLALDNNNNMYVVSSANQLGLGLYEVHTAKFAYGGSGTRAWDSYNQVTGSATITGVGIDIDAALNIYVLSDYHNGNSHYFHLKKYNTSGATQWSKSFSANPGSDNVPVSLSLSKEITNPSIFVAGYTAMGNINIVKFNNNGDTLWQKIYDCGNNGLDVASTMVTDNCNNIYITGHSNCNGTNKDVKTIKYSTYAPTITASDNTTFCQGDSVILESSPAIAYLWNTGATTQSITAKTSGNYSVTATYANGCTAASPIAAVTVTPAPPPPDITVIGSPIFCQGGFVTLTASAASSYQWNNGATTPNITVSTSGQYSVTVSNAAGCTSASLSAVSVTVLPLPTATITPVGPTTFCQGGSVTLTANSASFYNWSNGATTPSITVSTGGQYSVTITDINGCTDASSTTTVTVIPPPTATITPPGPVNLCEGESVTLTASTASAYEWSNGATTQSITVSTAGQYSVTVTGANTCTAASPATSVVVNPLPEATVTASGNTTFCEGSSVTLTSNPASSYNWSNGATTPSITVDEGGNYTVTITSANGCTDASTPTLVTVHPLPMVDLGNDITLTQGDSAILNAGQWSEYEWSTGTTTSTITVNSMGTYSVTVTNGFGCTAVDSIVVSVTSSTSSLDSRYKITVFPNPAQQAINIQCEGGATALVQVFDNFGKLVLEDTSFAPDGAVRTLFLDRMPEGIYYVRIAGEEFAKAISIVKHSN
ncbi:MAG: hypothetical protein OHK0019_28210 [Saprospiraceae bacterium]